MLDDDSRRHLPLTSVRVYEKVVTSMCDLKGEVALSRSRVSAPAAIEPGPLLKSVDPAAPILEDLNVGDIWKQAPSSSPKRALP